MRPGISKPSRTTSPTTGCRSHGTPDRRAHLRAELDAAFFHLYGFSRDDADYVLSTFPVLRAREEKELGEYRTRRLVLDQYDALVAGSTTPRPADVVAASSWASASHAQGKRPLAERALPHHRTASRARIPTRTFALPGGSGSHRPARRRHTMAAQLPQTR